MKGSKKFLHYKRDLLAPDRIDEIESRRADLAKAIKAKDLDAVKETSKQVRNTCEKSLAHYQAPGWIEENIEVFWVAIVVALGIRAFFLQPFRIPTGSMQPSLNGIVAVDLSDKEDWDKPWIGSRVKDFLISGRTYENIVAEEDVSITSIKDVSFFLFSRTQLTLSNGRKVVIGAPSNEVTSKIESIGNTIATQTPEGKLVFKSGIHFKKGEAIFKGYLTSGDLVLVDKMSYHFRQPKRGESFVFDTRGIDTNQTGKTMSSQQGGTHYIKRLVGVPGDKLQIKGGKLYVNGALAKEETIQRVMNKENLTKLPFPGYTPYHGYETPQKKKSSKSKFSDSDYVATLADPENDNNFREFFALGDNSRSSLDSRYWGSVKQHNLVGPAFISLWPFTSGHWGFIE